MKELGGAFPDERHAAGTGGFAVVASLKTFGMDVKSGQTVLAQAQWISFIHGTATAGTNKRAKSLGMVKVGSITACPTLEDLDIMMTVINHVSETTLLTDHRPHCWCMSDLRVYGVYLLYSIVQISLLAV